jgi:hypothetical protein
VAGSDEESCHWRDVGRLGGLSWEGFCWIDVGHRFGSGEFLLDRCGPQV